MGGWNARDPLANMEATDAIVLDNMIPGIGDIKLRNGNQAFATGLGGYIESLMVYSPPSGNEALFAATPTAIYDASSAGSVGAAVLSGKSNGRWQHTMFATSGGNFLVAANGADSVLNYNGSSWTTPTITGVTSSNLVSVTAHVQRLWFVENNSLDPWYLPVASIAGAATKLIVGPFAKLGGSLVAIGSWSRDGGSGAHDLLVLVTSEGEVIIYQGTDPDVADNFVQVGTYRIAKPIGRRCILKTGADLGILTAVGVVPLSQVLQVAITAQGHAAISDKIRNAFIQSYTTANGHFGWQLIEYPDGKLVIVNIPIAERMTQYQYVMNSDTGAWCRFININAGCCAVYGNNLFFGGNDGTVYRYEGYSDQQGTIAAVVQTSYGEFGTSQSKRFTMAQPLFRGPYGYIPAVEIKVDYDTSLATLPANTTASAASYWNTSIWNVALWSQGSVPSKSWQTLNGIGQFGSIAMKFSLSQEFALNSINVMYEPGGYF